MGIKLLMLAAKYEIFKIFRIDCIWFERLNSVSILSLFN